MRDFPAMRQSGLADCGPTCLAMIGAFHEQPIVYMGPARQHGPTLYDLALSAKRCGYSVTCVRVPDLQCLEDGRFPVVAHVTGWDDRGRFVVVVARVGQFVVLANPEDGQIAVERVDTFSVLWSGVVMLLEPVVDHATS